LTLSEQQCFVRDTACQSTKEQEEFGGHSFLGPPVYNYGCKKKERTVVSLLDVQSSADKKVAKTQDR